MFKHFRRHTRFSLAFHRLSIGFDHGYQGSRGSLAPSTAAPAAPKRSLAAPLIPKQLHGPWQICFKKPLKATLELFLKAFIRRRKKVSDGSVATRGASNWPSPRRRTRFGSTQVFVIGKSAKECAGAENAAKNQTRRNRLRVRTP